MGDDFANYGPLLASGHKDLLAWAKGIVDKYHLTPDAWQSRDLVATSGNTDGISKCIHLLTEPGDTILVDEFTYPGIMGVALPHSRNVEPVAMDAGGMSPKAASAAVGCAAAAGSRARLMYLTPHGQNPTGINQSPERKAALYAVARQHGLVIVEDDPYYFLNFSGLDFQGDLSPGSMPGGTGLPPSYLSMDEDGRVVRLDSVSKFIAPGLRLGWATGPKALMEKWRVFSEVTTWSISGPMQHSFLKMVADWTDESFQQHLQVLQSTYATKCSYVLAAMDKHLKDLCTWQPPAGGMFIWLRFLGTDDSEAIADELITTHGIAVVPGAAFTPAAALGQPSKSAHVRVSFTQIDAAKADEAMRRLAAGLRALLCR